MRLEAWIKVSSMWNHEGLIGLGLWSRNGKVLQSPHDLILYPSESTLSWSSVILMYVGSHKVFVVAAYVSSPCYSSTTAFVYDVRIYGQQQPVFELFQKLILILITKFKSFTLSEYSLPMTVV